MKIINGQILDQTAQRNNKLVCYTGINNRMDDLIVVKFLVLIAVVYMEKLINNISKLLGGIFFLTFERVYLEETSRQILTSL